MEQQRDYLDELLEDSVEDYKITAINIDENYNRILLEKLHSEKTKNTRTRTAALSLIAAGILLCFMYTSQFQYNLTNFELKLKTDISIVKHTVSLDNYLLGE